MNLFADTIRFHDKGCEPFFTKKLVEIGGNDLLSLKKLMLYLRLVLQK